MARKLAHRIPTPCIGVCSTGIGDSVCRGCKRYAHEVIGWNGYSQEQKHIIDQRLDHFLSQVVSNKLEVVDVALLKRQLDGQQIRYPAHRSPYVWAFELLRAGARQIRDPGQFGLALSPAYRDWDLVELREAIDREFYELSEAHFDRYMRVRIEETGS